ncbi:MAG: cell division protein ZapA [Peptococcaceae bacterium]|nr:cell division protein ZapA [Peptococcaceae bacterium]MDH7523876.1 cell division protein ZapA [Peptococcaceae bacterium]
MTKERVEASHLKRERVFMSLKDREAKGSKDKINRVNVRILNEDYVIKGDADTKHIEKVSSYVDLKMKQLTLKYPHLSPGKVAVLAAINIADEYLRLSSDYDELIKLLDQDKNNR